MLFQLLQGKGVDVVQPLQSFINRVTGGRNEFQQGFGKICGDVRVSQGRAQSQ